MSKSNGFVFGALFVLSISLLGMAHRASAAPTWWQLVRSSHCGDLKCEANRGESPSSCPLDCGTFSVRSANKQTNCENAGKSYEPTSAGDAERLVGELVSRGQHIRVAGRSHTASSLICSDDAVISTRKLNRIHGIETFGGVETVRFEAGVTIGELETYLHAKGKTLGFAVPGFSGVTWAGALATGTHGTSRHFEATLSSRAVSIRITSSEGRSEEFSERNAAPAFWKALRTNLGAFGLVTEVRAKIEDQFKLDTEIAFASEEEIFRGLKGERGARVEFGAPCDYETVFWFPGAKQTLRLCGNKTDKPADLGVENRLLVRSSDPASLEKERKMFHFARGSSLLACTLEKQVLKAAKSAPPLQITGADGKPSHPLRVVGYSHQILTSFPAEGQPFWTAADWEVAIPQQYAGAALVFAREFFKKNDICLPLYGIWLRFIQVQDSALVGHSTASGEFHAGDYAMTFEFLLYNLYNLDEGTRARLNEPYRRLISELIDRFHARPHWGKNEEWALERALERGAYGKNSSTFVDEARRFDPRGLFSNSFLNQALFQRRD
jgi:FAD/FMN-containing dehydrogenase